MKKSLRQVVALICIASLMVIYPALPVKAEMTQSEIAAAVSGTDTDSQKIVDALSGAIEHMGDPKEFAAWSASKFFEEMFKQDPLPGKKSEAEQINEILNCLTTINAMLGSIKDDIANSNTITLINNFAAFDGSNDTQTYISALNSIDQFNNINEEKLEARKKVFLYSLTGQPVGSEIADALYSNQYDGVYDTYKAFALTQFTSASNQQMYIVELYDKMLRTNVKWYHQYYKQKIYFQNYIYGKYLTVAMLEKNSLAARIVEYEKVHGVGEAYVLRAKYLLIHDDVQNLKRIYEKNKAAEPNPNQRIYNYPGNEMIIGATAKEQIIPCEPVRNEGINKQRECIIHHLSDPPLKGISGKSDSNKNVTFYPQLEFWRSFISYDSNALCPSWEWMQAVRSNYGNAKSLNDIFFDPNEGALNKPSGFDISSNWLYVLDPSNAHPLVYHKNTFEADWLMTPTIDSTGQTDYKTIYKYHADSNEPATDNRFIGIAVLGKPGIQEDETNVEPLVTAASVPQSDRHPSEVPTKTILMAHTSGSLHDMKAHTLDTRTLTNQMFLANYYAAKYDSAKKAYPLINYGLYLRYKIPQSEYGQKTSVAWANVPYKTPGDIYAVCYNETDKAYCLKGTIDSNGTAVFNNFIIRDCTNVTLFVLK